MMIAMTAYKEKIRRKELYIVSIIGVLILLLFSTGTGTLSIDGVPVTEYKMLLPILMIVVNVISCALAIVMSLSTIPNEYERNTSHLVWIRKISQPKYHGELALANLLISLTAEGILFITIVIFMLIKGQAGDIMKLIPAYLVMGISVAIVSLLTSVLSIRIPKMVAGMLAVAGMLIGVFYSLLELLKDVVGGLAGSLIKGMLTIMPNLHDIQSQAANILCGEAIDIHTLLKGLLVLYILTIGLFVFRRKEV